MNVENLSRASNMSFIELMEVALTLLFMIKVGMSRPIMSSGAPKDRIYGFC
jgi:hypothetical protein